MEFSDEEIKDLYLKLKLGFLTSQFGVQKVKDTLANILDLNKSFFIKAKGD